MMPLPRTGVPHLWVVLTEPDPITKKIAVVMVVTEKKTTDKTVTLDLGDHQFIARKSNVDYGGAHLYDVQRLEAAIVADDQALRENLKPKLLEKVRKGLYDSTHTPDWMKDYCTSRFDVAGKTVVAPTPKKP